MRHNKLTLKALFFAVVSCILFSCEPEVGDEWAHRTVQSYGYYFMRLDRFQAHQMAEGCIMVDCYQTFESVCGVDKNIELWEEFNKAHCDTAYNRDEMFHVAANGSLFGHTDHTFWAYDIDSILVVSDVDFDEDHPAGTLLNDIIRFVALSPMEYIRNGYSNSYDLVLPNDTLGIVDALYSTGYQADNHDFSVVEKTLQDCTPEDFMMISFARFGGNRRSPMCVLQFLSQPTLGTEHNIKIQIFGTDHKNQSSHKVWCKLTF